MDYFTFWPNFPSGAKFSVLAHSGPSVFVPAQDCSGLFASGPGVMLTSDSQDLQKCSMPAQSPSFGKQLLSSGLFPETDVYVSRSIPFEEYRRFVCTRTVFLQAIGPFIS